MPELPSGTVAFLFTDIEGSTRLWEQQPGAMASALARHEALLREAVEAHGGRVFKTVGDAVCAAFPLAIQALGAAVAAQRALASEPWGEVGTVRVRMAVHAGAAEERDDDYFGPPLNRVARLLAAGHGGQVLLSRAAHELVRDHLPPDLALRDLGEHRLKDLHHSERVLQVVAPDLPAHFPPLRTPEHLLRNLPVHPTPLIGREREVAAVLSLLGPTDRSDGSRLVTLTGPGGAGKTRLALHAASELAADFADGVYFVSLAPITDPELVLPEIAATLGVRETGGATLRELLREELRRRHLLVVLDNFEQVTAAAPAVADLLADCPRLAVLVTSRERLHLRGEQELPVPPLGLPDPAPAGSAAAGRPLALDDVAESEAVRLFVERARAVKPDFAVSPDNAAAVVEICRRLDGLPLAIELAAARVKLLPPKAMLGRFDRRLDLLAGGARDLPGRHQTMRGAIGWSYDLLDPDEQRLFARLAIFVGGCTLTAAEAVAGGAASETAECGRAGGPPAVPADPREVQVPALPVLDLVASLADKSLIRLVDDGEDEPRLLMLETIREYGLERLAASGEADLIGRRHADFFLALAEEAEPHLEGPEQTRWLDRLERDYANLRAGLAWLRDHGEVELGLRLGGALWHFWWLRAHFTEGRAQLDDLLLLSAPSGSAAARSKALNGAGVLAECQGDNDRAGALHEEALAIARKLDDKRGIAWSLNNLGVVALNQGDYDRARILLEENLTIARELGDTPGVATALLDLGNVAQDLGDFDRATALYAESLALFRRQGGDSPTARVLSQLGSVALRQGDYERAETLLSESLDLLQVADDRQGTAATLNNLAEVAKCQGDAERAAMLYEECRALAEEIGDKSLTAIALENLAELALRRGDHQRAGRLFHRALGLYRIVGDWLGIASCLAGLARIAAQGGRAQAATRLFGATAALRQAVGLPDPNGDEAFALATARAQLGEEVFAAAWHAGQETPIDRVVRDASEWVG